MTNEILEKGNKLKQEIENLERFISRFTPRLDHYSWRTINYKKLLKKGQVELNNGSSTYFLSNNQVQKIVKLLKQDLVEMQQEFERLGTENE